MTGYRSPPEIADKLFVDSLWFLPWIGTGRGRILDLGAGAGVPGLPIKIVEPRIALTLLEARRWRTSFLSTVVRELGLKGVGVLCGRAEALVISNPDLLGSFDTVVSRAAGPYRSMVPLAMTFLKAGGRLVVSGPPVEKIPPSLPHGIPHRWEIARARGTRRSRRFLIVEKS